jgi:cold shock CspA family protein
LFERERRKSLPPFPQRNWPKAFFVHYSVISAPESAFKTLKQDEAVEFETAAGEKARRPAW